MRCAFAQSAFAISLSSRRCCEAASSDGKLYVALGSGYHRRRRLNYSVLIRYFRQYGHRGDRSFSNGDKFVLARDLLCVMSEVRSRWFLFGVPIYLSREDAADLCGLLIIEDTRRSLMQTAAPVAFMPRRFSRASLSPNPRCCGALRRYRRGPL